MKTDPPVPLVARAVRREDAGLTRLELAGCVLAALALLVAMAALFWPGFADAGQVAPAVAASGVTFDLTGIATSLIAGIFAVLAVVVPLLISSHVKNVQAATVLASAVKNSLGALEQSLTTAAVTLAPRVAIPDVPARLQVPVQYILDHAGDEVTRLGVTPGAIAAKIDAQIGLTKLLPAVVPVAVAAPGTDAAPAPAAFVTAAAVRDAGPLADVPSRIPRP